MKTPRSKPSATSVSVAREAIARLAELRAASRYLQLPSTNRSRLDAVGPRLIEAAGATSDPDITLARGLNFLESIARRGSYLALLQQYPMALRRVSPTWSAPRTGPPNT
jgi:glutamate-ammonia-ligase adenylyltransferase